MELALAFAIGFVVAVWLTTGGGQRSDQRGEYKPQLDNIQNSILDMRQQLNTIQQRQTGLINFQRTIIRDNPRLKLTPGLLDEPEQEQEQE